jgi:hypothetical protein
VFDAWRKDWCLFAREVLKTKLDPEQEEILRAVQNERMITVASGTARGKDFVSAVAAVCFMYLTPKWDEHGTLVENTKVAMTAPTDRQVKNIMFPEVSRLFNAAKFLPGRLVGYDIRTDNTEWFLTGFKADDTKQEAWSGFHAVNTMFIVTEASGISELTYAAIEGNLQGNSRILLVFNPNTSTGYAANSHKSSRWKKFRLDSLSAPNVKEKRIIIPGQVDYPWIEDKVRTWCTRIDPEDFKESEGDFYFDLDGVNQCFRPNDLFRVKVRGMFPKVSSDVLVPIEWIELANKRWEEQQVKKRQITKPLRLGVDVAGMGRDASSFCHRFGDYVDRFDMIYSAGQANHMQVAGLVKATLRTNTKEFSGIYAQAFIDTIGEGAGVYSRLEELKETETWIKVFSCKFSEAADDGEPLKDVTGQYEFLNMRAYLYWAIRDWLNPDNKNDAMLPPDSDLLQELSETKWRFTSNGKVQIEAKEDIKARIGRSPDKSDALANTFWPVPDIDPTKKGKSKAWMSGLR